MSKADWGYLLLAWLCAFWLMAKAGMPGSPGAARRARARIALALLRLTKTDWPAGAPIQNDSGLLQDSPPALWQGEREVARLEVSKAHSSNLLMTSLASREGLSWETLSGGII
jgi:hypothetical protein